MRGAQRPNTPQATSLLLQHLLCLQPGLPKCHVPFLFPQPPLALMVTMVHRHRKNWEGTGGVETGTTQMSQEEGTC